MRKIGLFVLALVCLSLAVSQVTSPASATGAVKVKGTIDSVMMPILIVSGTVVVATSQTIITQDGVPIAFVFLHVGMTVKVTGTLQADGSLLALEIKVLVN